MAQDEGRSLDGLNNVGHRERLTRSGHNPAEFVRVTPLLGQQSAEQSPSADHLLVGSHSLVQIYSPIYCSKGMGVRLSRGLFC